MASDFQYDKTAWVFVAMDVDGCLTENDFRALTARWAALRARATTPG
jgi:hypothetical protein